MGEDSENLLQINLSCRETHDNNSRTGCFVGMTNAAKQANPIAPLFHCHIEALIYWVVAQAEQSEVK